MSDVSRWPVLFVPHLLVLAACGATANQLTTRASFDLGCPQEQLEIVRLDNQTQGVRGCGKQATYVEVCRRPDDLTNKDCTWVKNDATTNAK